MGLSQGLFRVLSFCKWGPLRAMNVTGQVEEEQVNAVGVGPGISAPTQPLREIFLRLILLLLLLLVLLVLVLLLLLLHTAATAPAPAMLLPLLLLASGVQDAGSRVWGVLAFRDYKGWNN